MLGAKQKTPRLGLRYGDLHSAQCRFFPPQNGWRKRLCSEEWLLCASFSGQVKEPHKSAYPAQEGELQEVVAQQGPRGRLRSAKD